MIDTRGGGSTQNRFESVASDFLEEEKKIDTRTFKLEEDFLYGLVTGSNLESWQVIKYNKKQKPKDRMLLIDGFNIRHEKTQDNRGFFSSLVPGSLLKSSKSKQKPISQIN